MNCQVINETVNLGGLTPVKSGDNIDLLLALLQQFLYYDRLSDMCRQCAFEGMDRWDDIINYDCF